MNDVQEFTGRPACLYVIEFDSGTVKVGQSANTSVRLADHARHAAVHGHTMRRTWLSAPHSNFRATETALISFCSARWAPVSREYFPGADYEEVVRYAATLYLCEASPAEHETGARDSGRAFRAAVLDRFAASVKTYCADPNANIPAGHRRLIEAGFGEPLDGPPRPAEAEGGS